MNFGYTRISTLFSIVVAGYVGVKYNLAKVEDSACFREKKLLNIGLGCTHHKEEG